MSGASLTTGLVRKIAINPLPWILAGDGYRLDRAVLETAMSELARIGFTHLTVELPSDMTPAEYGELLASHSLTAAPGYFSASFQDRDAHTPTVESIRRHAAALLELGVDTAFIAADLTPERMAHPAVGFGGSRDTSLVVAEGLAAAAEAAAVEGVRYGLHPHVASMVEVEDEVRTVLDATAGSALYFGPDTGHLRWAGMTPQALIADYSDRVLDVHIKDVDGDAADGARSRAEDYATATGSSKVWTEPGRGSIDFDAVVAALPAEFAGWFVVEVDVPNVGDATLSSETSLEFLRGHPYFSGRDRS